MTANRGPSESSHLNKGTLQDQPEELSGIARPVARRMAGLSRGPAQDTTPNSATKASSAPTTAEQRASAWTKYAIPAVSGSPPHEPIVPPADTEATLATQAAAQQMWESHAAAESDQTASTTPPPESPPPQAPTNPVNLIQTMLNGLGSAGTLTNQQAMQLHDTYLKTLKAALTSVAPASNTSASHNPSEATQEPPKENQEYAANGYRTAEATISRPKAERVHPANGSLSMLPETTRPAAAAPMPEPTRSLPPLPARMPPPSPFYPPNSGAPPATSTPQLAPQQMVELLGEMLRAQAAGAAPMQQSSLPLEQPPLIMNSSTPQYPNFRFNSTEAGFKQEPAAYSAPMDTDTYNKLAARRWNSCASLASDSSMFSGSAGFASQNSLPSIPHNLTTAESQALLQALQQKYQASELESIANMTIQSILTGSANREAHGARKRKISDFYDEQAKRHNSLMSDGENYQFTTTGQQQICAECGTTTTPTWRRSGKRLMCNACGLRRSRSIRSARSASMPMSAQAPMAMLEHPMEELAKLPPGM